jgi:tetratricopeptide (TPR) repeat protein
MNAGLIILIGTDVVLAVVGIMLVRSRWADSERGIPFSVALLLCFGAFALHMLAYVVFAGFMVHEEGGTPDAFGKLTAILICVATGLVPAVIFGAVFLKSAASAFTTSLFGTQHGLSPEAMAKARAMVSKGDIDGALGEYRRLAEEYPDVAEPLLAAGGVLEVAKRYEEAAALYKEVVQGYGHDDDAWTRAARRLVKLYQGPLDNPANANRLTHEMNTRQGRAKPDKGNVPTPRMAPAVAMDAARRKAERGDVDGAVDTYSQQFVEKPKSARPMFEAATTLEREQRYEDAAEMLKKISREFRDDDTVWCEAAYRLANLTDNNLGDKEMAVWLLRQIVKRRPGTDVARMATSRLMKKT